MAISIEAPAGVKYFIGIVRVSEVGKRDPSRLRSPTEQRESIVREATRLGGEVATVKEEIDISGKLPLAKRKKLLWAVQEVEAGHAHGIIVAYFDRLARNLDT